MISEKELRRRQNISKAQKGKQRSKQLRTTLLKLCSIEEWAYIAGIFDGEGSLETNKWGNLRVSISQNGFDLHNWLIQKLGFGSISRTSTPKNNQFRLATQYHVFQFLKAVSPFLIVKRDRAFRELKRYEKERGWR